MNTGSAPSARVQSTAHSNYLYQTTTRKESRQTTTARFSLENAAQAAEARSAKTDFTVGTHSVTTSNFTAGISFVRQSSSDAALKTSAEIPTVSGTDAVSAKDMTMDEYKAYIHEQISQIQYHPTRMMESHSITISESGFKAMKEDPEYEAWVLNDLRVGCAQPDHWSAIVGGAYHTTYYGATKEECRSQGWAPGYQNGNGEKLFNEKSKDSFWQRKVDRKNQLQKQYDQKRTRQKQQQELYEQMLFNQNRLYQQLGNRAFQSSRANAATLF